MKKFALALMAASAAVFGIGMVTSAAGYDPAVTVNPAAPTAGGSYSVTYQNCAVGDTITFSQPQSTPTSVTGTCVAVDNADLAGSVIGLLLPQQTPALGNATGTFTAAPLSPGTYNGTAVGQRSATQTFAFTIPGQASTTSTTLAPTTTLAATTTTAAPVTTAPVTTPGTGLPATGSDGVGVMTGIALGLFAVGLGLFIVAQVRRKQSPTAV
jgi:hypothetical protein